MKLKLRPDSLIEALVEVRFTSSDVADIIPAKLSTLRGAEAYQMQRLPVADVPLAMRQSDPNLAFLPVLQQRSADGTRVMNSGPQVLSWHAVGAYPGWSVFQPEISASINHCLKAIKDIRFTRIGIRYFNAFGPQHNITSINDLSLSIKIGQTDLVGEINLNYHRTSPGMSALVKVATPSFVENATTQFSVLMDIDVATQPDFTYTDPNQIIDWLEKAHMLLKTEYFSVLPEDTIAALAVS